MSDTAAPAAESKTSTDEQSFLSRLVDFGDELIAAERPITSDVPKVLGGLIHWIDQGGGFEAPEYFNPNLSQAVAEQEAEQSRLAKENAELSTRLSSLETLMRQQIAAQAQTPEAPAINADAPTPSPTGASPVTASEGAAPAAPAAPSPGVVPGVPAPAAEAPAINAPPAAAPEDPETPPQAPPVVSE